MRIWLIRLKRPRLKKKIWCETQWQTWVSYFVWPSEPHVSRKTSFWHPKMGKVIEGSVDKAANQKQTLLWRNFFPLKEKPIRASQATQKLLLYYWKFSVCVQQALIVILKSKTTFVKKMASSESIYFSSEARKNSVVHNHIHKDSFNTVTLKKSSNRKGKVIQNQTLYCCPFAFVPTCC